ncbi:Zona pellucida sperm-binding protein 3 [Anabarilius grahami]|uniref:Zona pellucida sperm-binding protein 3 n=2 Tax=Cyprinoidei TaxID=30727 RepID=A0A3N0XPA6_ANAGA|nr:Zona pellucida sperm-binding protein 3 [Anabarilius grahami]
MELLRGVLVMVVLVAFDLPDAWGSLRYSQSPRSMRPKSDPASGSPALSPLGLWNPLQVASQFQSPLSSVSRNLAQDPFGLQEKQLLQGPVKPLDWRYPIVPEVQRELAVDFQLRQPVTPSSVAVQCSENRVLVEVQQDLFSNGQLIQPTGLSLGGCPVVGQDTEARVLIFEYELQDCNSVLMMNEDELVYTFSLTYTPEALAGTPITRADDDWSYQRPSNSYFLGGVINIEASVKVYNHVPLRVFVDRCVATQGPDVNSLPRYSFIENHGCFVDAKATASSSRFMPRSQEDKIQFQLEAFMFQESSSPYVYITCILKATIASVPSDAQRKSCSFANEWFAADGNNQVCGCCDSTCGPDGGFASPYGEDWSYQRPSNSFFLGAIINIEASVNVYNHVPLRVFVDSCVATQGPDVNSLPRYSFIENHGCFVDAKATASSSRFMPRSQEDKIQFQLEEFMFQESSSPYVCKNMGGLLLMETKFVVAVTQHVVLMVDLLLLPMEMNEDELVYTFSLTYTPEALAGTPITRADGAVVGIQCHYQRLQNVSSNALRPTWVPYASTESPLSPVSRNLAQDPFGLQEKQLLQGPVKPLDWRYPVVPEVQRELAVDFQLRQPVTPSSVAVQCSENRVLVEVQQDLFSNGQLIQPTGLSLGGCPVVGQDTEARVLIFEYELQDCNSVLMMNEDELVYTFSLTYTPEALAGTPITRADGAVVGIQCHYQRLQNVSSNALRPTWVPYASTGVGEEVLLFSLKLMMDDWSYQRPSNSYFLGGIINIEASVNVYNHVPLRVFVDSCVATQGPDVNSLPRYSFIENHGCFVDAKATASSSRFLPRSQEEKIQFQLEAFMFQESSSPYIYITCILKATIASVPSDAQRKSCSFANGWFAADGNNQVCGCCDSTCGPDGGFSSPYGGLWNPLQVASQFQSPLSPVSRNLAQDPFGLQEKQLLQGPVKPLDWRYPVVPEVQRELAVDFQLRQPVIPSSVAVQCSENRVLVEVQQDLFSNGQLIQPTGLSLGGCPVVGQDTEARVLIFEYELQDCNSVLMMNEDELVYTFSLTYTPEALAGTPITRADGAVVGVQCHYQRLQNVSSNALRPTWVPYASTEVGEEVLLFSLKLMMDDWSYQRPSNSYFLGGVINIEASVKVYNHVPLRVFVDSCVATQGPDVNSLPRYSFIENHGCFVDAKATASSSRFMPRSQEDKIQFQLEAFMFQESSSPYVCKNMGGLLLMVTTKFVVAVTQHVVLMVDLLLLPMEVQRELAVDFQLRQPVTPSSVAVQCSENRVLVEVQQDLFTNGQLIQPTGLSLGGCSVVGQDTEARVLIFDCVATQGPDVNSLPRYSFIENHGCFVDAKATASSSRFMPRSLEDKIQFQLEAFDPGELQSLCGLLLMETTKFVVAVTQHVVLMVDLLLPLEVGFWNPLQVASQFQSPLRPVSRNLAQDPFGLQEKQLLQGPVKPLDWRYPVVPEVQRELAVDFQLRQPVTPSSVAVQCSENRVLVEVQQDLFSNGQLIQPTGLSLGGCPVVGQDTEARVLIFEYELQDCNSVLMMNEDELVYTFSLTYTPEALAGTPITRADGAIVGVQCHYQRLQNVSSNALRPTWAPYASTEVGEEVLLFSLKLMMDDWSYQRPSNSYFLGSIINIEASVKVYNHVPLRVFVDSCVASQGPDVNSLPRYSFIENHGCFVDAKATASSSRFMPRSQEDKIQFQLEAFMFQEGNSPYIYITCILKATIASVPSDALRKSCSFTNGWSAADGNNQVCGCCDSTCGPDGEFAAPYGGMLVMVLLVAFDLPDAWGSLRYSQSPRSMRPKSDPASRSPALSPLGLWNPLQVASQFQSPLSPVSRNLAQDPFGLQEKQLLQGPVKPLDWRYPVVPEVQRELAVDFQLRQPVTPSSVAVQCSENRVLVEVQQDLFSNGQLIQPTGLSLGGCPVVGQDTEARVLIFEYELQDCNSVLMMNEDELVYTFSLSYTPEALAGTPITRADGAVIGIQCHYQRVLLSSADDWSYQRPSNSYFLGGIINIEASVKVYNHVPLRVFVDSCVATQGPDVNSLPRYSFIENYGCFVDAKATSSSSRFMPRSQEDKIQFQLEAFMFQESSSPYIYITCILKATIASVPSDAQRKSCSFANGWFAADGNNQVCGCCDSACGPDGGIAAAPYGGVQWEGKASLGPVMIQEQKTRYQEN